jgi:hypothetical protein
MIGGSGERKTLRLVAQYGDACNLFAQSRETVAHKLEVLRRHCDDVGRDYDEIAKTILYVAPTLQNGDHDGFLRDMEDYSRLGVTEVGVMPSGGRAEDWIRAHCAPVAPRLATL